MTNRVQNDGCHTNYLYLCIMKKETDCRRFTARIFTSEYVDGNGVVISDCLITAAHVLDGSRSFDVWVDNSSFKIETNSALFFQVPIPNEKGDFLDLAVYKLEDIQSPVGFFEGDLSEADINCMAWKHSVDSKTHQEVWTPFETDAMFIESKGNFIECMMSDPLVQGYSGCLLFADDKLVGTLYGSGDDGRTCFFLSYEAIKKFIDTL